MYSQRFQTLLLNLGAAMAYAGFGLVSTGLTRSPEYFTPVWIPAGVTVFFVLVWGARTYPGILAGAIGFHFLFHAEAMAGAKDLAWFLNNFDYVLPIAIQCFVARRMFWGFATSEQFHPGLNALLQLVLRTALVALVLPVFTNLALWIRFPESAPAEISIRFLQWWFGDFLGILCLIPLPVLVLQGRGETHLRLLFRYIAPVLVYFFALVVGYRMIAHGEVKGVQDRFEAAAAGQTDQISREVQALFNHAELLRIQFLDHHRISRERFVPQVELIHEAHPAMQAFNWIPLVHRADRSRVEEGLRESFGPDFHFRRRIGDTLEVLPDDLSEPILWPITIAAPEEGNLAALGMDVSVFAGTAIRRAVETGEPQALAPIRLAQETGEQRGVVIYFPVEAASYEHLADLYPTGGYGLFDIVLRMDDFVAQSWNRVPRDGMRLRLVDVTDPGEPATLAAFDGTESVAELDDGLVQPVFAHTSSVHLANRRWQITIEALPGFFQSYHSTTPFLVLVGGLLVSFLLGIFSLATFLRTRLIEQAVEEKTSALREAKNEAERLAQAKMDFLAVMSHEIRTPMNGMISTAEMLRESPLDPEQAELAQIIDLSAHTLLALINDILDFSKLEAGKATLECTPFDPFELARTVEATFRAKVRAKGLHFRLENEPAEGPAVELLGDRSRLLQVLMNLVSNAVKFTAEGEVTLTTAIAPTSPNEVLLTYRIQDSGVGISPEKVEELFEPFTQADHSTTRQHGGTGLGLAITKRIVNLVHGEVSVESIPGEGSTFSVRIPFPLVRTHARAAQDERPASDPSPAGFEGARVLVVEDNAQNLLIMEILLKRLGVSIATAKDGVNAVEACASETFDLVFMDCQLPTMDGYEASRIIRMNEAPGVRVPIIALTASSFEGARERCLAAGMDDFLTKPVTRTSIANALKAWIPTRSAAS